MILASQLRNGMAIRFEGHPWKVLVADYHPGQGKMGGVSHARLLNLDTGTQWEHSFRADLKLEDIPLERKPMQFLYAEGDRTVFMDPETADQAEIPNSLIGEKAGILMADIPVSVEFLEDRPVSVILPDFIEIAVSDTMPPAHSGGTDTTWKPATLINGLQVMVPQFIKPGDAIRVDMATLKYMDRAKSAAR